MGYRQLIFLESMVMSSSRVKSNISNHWINPVTIYYKETCSLPNVLLYDFKYIQ